MGAYRGETITVPEPTAEITEAAKKLEDAMIELMKKFASSTGFGVAVKAGCYVRSGGSVYSVVEEFDFAPGQILLSRLEEK